MALESLAFVSNLGDKKHVDLRTFKNGDSIMANKKESYAHMPTGPLGCIGTMVFARVFIKCLAISHTQCLSLIIPPHSMVYKGNFYLRLKIR